MKRKRLGIPGAGRNGIVPRPAIERVRDWIEIDPATGCHNFTGAVGTSGYGSVRLGGKGTRSEGVHRIAYAAALGPIPAGLQIDHLCRNRRCCNPEHLEAVTPKINTLRGKSGAAINAAKTHCAWGHEFSPENTYTRPDGHRQCLACVRRRRIARAAPAPDEPSLSTPHLPTGEGG